VSQQPHLLLAPAVAVERVHISEAAERQRIVAEYETQLALTQRELDKVREDTAYTLAVMQQEMDRWRHQAQLMASAVIEAKNEVGAHPLAGLPLWR
jgi:hypothetical protein